jgi:hypothetical protein
VEVAVKHVELLWFQGCPNHETARRLIDEVIGELGIDTVVEPIEVPDEETGNSVQFPGSPTIRVDGRDIEPGFEACEDCTPRCRVYPTRVGLRGLPEREWLVAALSRASGS